MKSRGLVLIFCIISLQVFSQNKEALEQSKIKNLKELDKVNELLKTTTETKSKTLNELRIIDKRIELRYRLIGDIEMQISLVDDKIKEKEEVVTSLNADLAKKKREYEELIILAYKNKNAYNKVMYILAAENINKAYKRYKYLQRITDYRKKQAVVIEEIKKVQEQKLLELTIIKQEKEVLLLQRKEEFAQLSNEKVDKRDIVNELSTKEKQLKRELREKEQVLTRIENEIRKIIEAELKKSSGSLYDRLTPQERIISSEFEKNKGHLPWPTYKGVVTSKFGLQNHPVLRGVKTNNNGIDITSVKESEVKAIFNGKVSLIAAIPGGNYAIIIKHGQFFTVYQNIVKVSVKQGDRVVTNQRIGVVYSGTDDNNGVLHFEIRKEKEKLNPEVWLAN